MITHTGYLSEATRIWLGVLRPTDTITLCSRTDAFLVDVGYVLHRKREFVQIIDNPRQHGQDPNCWELRLARGFNGSFPLYHEPGGWTIEATPQVDYERRPYKYKPWTCEVCGGPNEEAVCRWCRQGRGPL